MCGVRTSRGLEAEGSDLRRRATITSYLPVLCGALAQRRCRLQFARINCKHKLVPFWVATPAGLLLVRPHYLPTLAATAAALPAA